MGLLGTIFAFIFGFIVALLVAIFGFFGFVLPGFFGGTTDFDQGLSDAEPAWTAYGVPISVDAAWLEMELEVNPDLVVVDVASLMDYEAGHIPGAVRIDPADIEIAGTEDAGWQADVELVLGQAGISPDSSVVIYDRNDLNATRVWWALTRLSHSSVGILDGGLAAWEDGAGSIELGSGDVPAIPQIYAGIVDESLVASTYDVEAALGDSTIVIIDARSAAEFAAGHIPGAINIPSSSLYAADGRLLDYDALFALFADAGAYPDQDVIVYCASGVAASNVVYALNVLGYWSVEIYAGSWPEWTSDPTRPVEE